MPSPRCSISTIRATRASGSPTCYGGRENLDAIDFLKGVNEVARAYVPGALTIAEESTAWPGVSRPVSEGAPNKKGLGFDFKWNMGWMHDTLQYMSQTRSTGSITTTR